MPLVVVQFVQKTINPIKLINLYWKQNIKLKLNNDNKNNNMSSNRQHDVKTLSKMVHLQTMQWFPVVFQNKSIFNIALLNKQYFYYYYITCADCRASLSACLDAANLTKPPIFVSFERKE